MTLPYKLNPPGDPAGEAATVFVLLHGRGSDMNGLKGLAGVLPPSSALVTPQASWPGAAWGYGGGWAWYRYMGGNRVDPRTLDRSLEELDDFIASLDEILPVPHDKIVLGGFSQGGTTSLAYGIRRPGKVTGIVNLSGFLAHGILEPGMAEAARAASGLPVFWGHGTMDPNIPHRMAVEGRATLSAAECDLTARDYPMGHVISPEEMADVVAWEKTLTAP